MKKYFAALSATALISLAPYALATDTLTVTGTITPAACLPSLSGGGMIDVGKIRAKDLNQTTETQIGSHPIQLTVACDAPIPIALNPIDNKPGTATNPAYFGLGETNALENLGGFYTAILATQADGVMAEPIFSDDGGTSWSSTSSVTPGELLSVASLADHSTPIEVAMLTLGLEIRPMIARADSLTLTDDVTLDGSVTFEVKYL
ncbi:DUF1120 domain-containing protein [Pseudomonas sp. PD9R]|uniref:DUF1120 domain-containing protein n=1 Tax=Pseudomonas sp. PD9R TaxID=2853534 RepID=UPI001C46DE0D|nr:DUF1120 domain-containing protein [Pseudomonas sp. PD9R]MBV6827099.1 DUF1120 domain-containing protein [Pseudomonas sp. PD9R]